MAPGVGFVGAALGLALGALLGLGALGLATAGVDGLGEGAEGARVGGVGFILLGGAVCVSLGPTSFPPEEPVALPLVGVVHP